MVSELEKGFLVGRIKETPAERMPVSNGVSDRVPPKRLQPTFVLCRKLVLFYHRRPAVQHACRHFASACRSFSEMAFTRQLGSLLPSHRESQMMMRAPRTPAAAIFVWAMILVPIRAAQHLVPPPDATAQADRIFSTFAKTGSPGCTVGAAIDGTTVLSAAYGMADLERNVPLTPQSVRGELTGSSGYRSLVQTSTVSPPPVRTETSRCYSSSRRRFRHAPFQPRVRSMAVIVMLKIDQLRLQIGRGPE